MAFIGERGNEVRPDALASSLHACVTIHVLILHNSALNSPLSTNIAAAMRNRSWSNKWMGGFGDESNKKQAQCQLSNAKCFPLPSTRTGACSLQSRTRRTTSYAFFFLIRGASSFAGDRILTVDCSAGRLGCGALDAWCRRSTGICAREPNRVRRGC